MPLITVILTRTKIEKQEVWIFAKDAEEGKQFAQQRLDRGLDRDGSWALIEENISLEAQE